jgi:hypothetical protein
LENLLLSIIINKISILRSKILLTIIIKNMELIFNNYQPGLWISEFEVTQDFNLHIERVDSGYLYIKQRSTPKGLFDNIKGASFDHADPVVDVDFVGTIYPKYIQVVSKVEPTYAEVTSNGEVTEISANKVKLEFVDLGLPSGLQWATCNLGATKPEEFGLYFQWGETQGYTGITDEKIFRWTDYTLCDGTLSNMLKYNATDGLTTLELSDDAATAVDSGCRMPTSGECQELIDNTTSELVADYNGTGVAGRLFTSNNNGNSIFVPAAGGCSDGSVVSVGRGGGLWSSSLYTKEPESAFGLTFGSTVLGMFGVARYDGISVRPVRPVSH